MSAAELSTADHSAGRATGRLARLVAGGAWWCASLALFVGIWELTWAVGWSNPMLMPPPHIFLEDFLAQGRLFDRATRMGNPSAVEIVLTVLSTVASSMMRVLVGLAIAFVGSLAAGLAMRYAPLFAKLMLPTVNLLAPVSPIAWLPVAIAIFGIGNAPAIFLVFIALFFIMTLATLSLIDDIPLEFVQLARIMGATRWQIFLQVILPAILPGLFVVMRLNLFAAWMIVLIAESAGVNSGLGLVVMVARNTFDAQLAFFTMTIIGVTGFLLDLALRQFQHRVLYWVPQGDRSA